MQTVHDGAKRYLLKVCQLRLDERMLMMYPPNFIACNIGEENGKHKNKVPYVSKYSDRNQ